MPCPVCGCAIPVRPTTAGGKQRKQCSVACYRRANSARTRAWSRQHFASYPEVREKRAGYNRRKNEDQRRTYNVHLRCGECGVAAPLDAIHRPRNKAWLCSGGCRLQRKKKTFDRWIEANRDHVREAWAVRRKQQTEQNPNYFKELYSKNKERRKRDSREWYRANAEHVLERQKSYLAKRMAEIPDLIRAQKRASSSKRRAIEMRVFVELVDSRVVFERDKGKCGICMKPVHITSKWEVDHIIPISRGGAHSYANVQLAHRSCNRSKCAKLPTGQPTLFQVVAT